MLNNLCCLCVYEEKKYFYTYLWKEQLMFSNLKLIMVDIKKTVKKIVFNKKKKALQNLI